MKRRLIIMRHAKSSWKSDAPTDHARPLNNRGRKDAPRVSQRLVDIGWQPQLVLSSDSQRTRETCQLMHEAWVSETKVPVKYLRPFYAGGVDEVVPALTKVPDDVTSVLALGHNPGWEEVVAWLCGQPVHLTTAKVDRLSFYQGHRVRFTDHLPLLLAWLIQQTEPSLVGLIVEV